MEMGVVAAARKYNVSKQGIFQAIKRGALPAIVVQTSELRVKPKDVEAWAAKIPPYKRRAARLGGLAKAAKRRNGATRAG